MDNKTAKQIISEAINIAIAKGCFGLVEVTNIVKAVEFLSNQPDIEFGEITEDNTTADYSGSVILGNGAMATESNQFVIGSKEVNAGSVIDFKVVHDSYWNVKINGVDRKIMLGSDHQESNEIRETKLG